MLVIGLTGGIGSGKSAVASRLGEKAGVRIVNADAVARRLMVEDPRLRADLVERFGPDTYDAAGALDRAGLAARVFGDAEEVSALNALVHPTVLHALAREIERARADEVDLLVIEAALFHEIGVDELVDAVVLVDAPLELRVQRVMSRDSASREQVLARAAHQLSSDELRARAGFVITNDSDVAHLNAQVDELYSRLGNGPTGPG